MLFDSASASFLTAIALLANHYNANMDFKNNIRFHIGELQQYKKLGMNVNELAKRIYDDIQSMFDIPLHHLADHLPQGIPPLLKEKLTTNQKELEALINLSQTSESEKTPCGIYFLLQAFIKKDQMFLQSLTFLPTEKIQEFIKNPPANWAASYYKDASYYLDEYLKDYDLYSMIKTFEEYCTITYKRYFISYEIRFDMERLTKEVEQYTKFVDYLKENRILNDNEKSDQSFQSLEQRFAKCWGKLRTVKPLIIVDKADADEKFFRLMATSMYEYIAQADYILTHIKKFKALFPNAVTTFLEKQAAESSVQHITQAKAPFPQLPILPSFQEAPAIEILLEKNSQFLPLSSTVPQIPKIESIEEPIKEKKDGTYQLQFSKL